MKRIVKRVLELANQRFGRLLVVEEVVDSNPRKWVCKCDCNKSVIVPGSSLRNGGTKSCGCLNKDLASARMKTHGMSHEYLYSVWYNMIKRCSYNRSGTFVNYGGRGIRVCEEWQVFENFYAWAKPLYSESLHLDREDNNKGYYPANCRFVSRSINMCNQRKRQSKLNNTGITANGRGFNAHISYESVPHYIGTFPTIREAVIARNEFITKNNFPHKLQEVPE